MNRDARSSFAAFLRTPNVVGTCRSCLVAVALLLGVTGCAPQRTPVPAGEIPLQQEVSVADEEYGQAVLGQLLEQYPLSNNDSDILRVRKLVDRLTTAAHADGNPWHVQVLEDRQFKNAAATKGNYIFVWSALLGSLQNDDELATVLAHEIGHVLAGHVKPTPQEEAQEILAGVVGNVAGQALSAYGGTAGLAANLAGSLVEGALRAFLVNPEQQRKELEADQIGLFLMADAGLDPASAVAFWDRVRADPSFGGTNLGFLSTHPSSNERLRRLDALLPAAQERYEEALRNNSAPLPYENRRITTPQTVRDRSRRF